MTLRTDPRLPPLYRLHRTQPDADMRALGRRHGDGGGEPGTVFWSPRADRFQAAMILAPENPLRVAALAVYLGMLALGDALGSLIPPGIDVTFLWPNRINLNGARLGAVELDVPRGITPATTPDWLVLSFDLAITGGPEATADSIDVNVTNLVDEGCGEVTSGALLEALARHALTWSNRWHDDGFAPLRPAWIARVEAAQEPIDEQFGGGRFVDLDAFGDLRAEADGAARTVKLLDALGCLDDE